MSEFWGHTIGVIIVLLCLLFLAIWIWAWRPKHRANFQRMANIPREDTAGTQEDLNSTTRSHS